MSHSFSSSTDAHPAERHRRDYAIPPPSQAQSKPSALNRPPSGSNLGGSEPGKTPPGGAPGRRRAKRPETAQPFPGSQEIVIMGAGATALELYVPALLTLQQSQLLTVSAIVDPRESAREAMAALFPKASCVSSVEAVTVAPDALALLTTPARFHSVQTASAFKRGWHVLCTTPFAPSAREGALMIAAAQRNDRLLAVDLRTRFFPAARYLRTLCRDFLLGPPLSFQARVGQPRVTPAGRFSEKFDHPEGVLTELGVHAIDLLTWCLGSASILRYADDAMGGVEANASIELSFGDGVRGSVHLSQDWPTDDTYTFVFERGVVRWGADRPNHLTLQIASAPAAIEGELVTPLGAASSQPLSKLLGSVDQACVAQLENFIAAISGRETLRAPATEAMHSLPLIEECYARREPLLQPWLTQNEAVQARVLCPPALLRRP